MRLLLPRQGWRVGATIARLARILSFRFLSERRTLVARLRRRIGTKLALRALVFLSERRTFTP